MTLKYECYLIVLVNVHSVWLRAELLGCWTCDLLTGHVWILASLLSSSTLDTLKTHEPLWQSSIIWYQPCGWDGNRRFSVALAMHHTLVVLHLWAQGLGEGDEHPSTLFVKYGELYRVECRHSSISCKSVTIYATKAFCQITCMSTWVPNYSEWRMVDPVETFLWSCLINMQILVTVCVSCSKAQKFWGIVGADPRNIPLPNMCYPAKFGCSRSNGTSVHIVYTQGHQNWHGSIGT